MLTGAYPMSVDAKGRVTLPAVFRKQLVDEMQCKCWELEG